MQITQEMLAVADNAVGGEPLSHYHSDPAAFLSELMTTHSHCDTAKLRAELDQHEKLFKRVGKPYPDLESRIDDIKIVLAIREHQTDA